MYPYIVISDQIKAPTYSLCFLVGYIFSILLCRRNNPKLKNDILYASIYAAFGIGIGAKLFYTLTALFRVFINFKDVSAFFSLDRMVIANFLFGGLVFYGGLFGAVFGIWIYCKQYKINFLGILYAVIPYLPLTHAWGRVGCFLAGCCYGKEYHGFLSVTYPYSELVPHLNEVPRFPVQLLESLCNILIFIILIIAQKKVKNVYLLLSIYLLLYSITRFFDEFLRGDVDRGVFGKMSTSQIISIFVFAFSVFLIFKVRKQKQKQPDILK